MAKSASIILTAVMLCASAAVVCSVAICFPATSTVRRLSSDGTWEKTPMPQLRIGDTVECWVREPVFKSDGSVTSAAAGKLSRCRVYDYKKAMTTFKSPYTTLIFEDPKASNKVGSVSMTPNHHVLDAKTNLAKHAGSIQAGDLLLLASEGSTKTVKVLKTSTAEAQGAYLPLLTQGGLLIVDGIVSYPSSGKSDVGLDAKHWGQYYLTAPLWQANTNSNAFDKTLMELGSAVGGEVGAFTKKVYAIGEAAAKEGRKYHDWAGVAAEMHSAIEAGKKYTEAEALGVYDRHILEPTE